MIVVENVSKDFYGVPAVSDISFQVNEGEVMVLLGTSGCGKTTTLKMLNRLIEVSSGRIQIGGSDITGLKPEILRRTIGYVSQNNGLFPHFTIEENVAVVPKLLKRNEAETAQKMETLLDQLKLPLRDYGRKFPDELSGGQKQRIALARALISDPPVLLMDEPFGALDPVTRLSIRDEFLTLQKVKPKTVVLVTHDVQEAFALGNRICLMDKGRIVQEGTPRDLMFQPASNFVRDFFTHQRYMLELTSLTFNEIWAELPETTDIAKPTLPASESLWNGIGYLSEQKLPMLFISKDNIVKTATLEQIQSAYSRIKHLK